MNYERANRIRADIGLPPLTGITRRQSQSKSVIHGVGTELKRLLSNFGLEPAPGCECDKHITEMDRSGIDWCSKNIEVIVGWLKEEARRAKLPFIATGARILVKRAISNASRTP